FLDGVGDEVGHGLDVGGVKDVVELDLAAGDAREGVVVVGELHGVGRAAQAHDFGAGPVADGVEAPGVHAAGHGVVVGGAEVLGAVFDFQVPGVEGQVGVLDREV